MIKGMPSGKDSGWSWLVAFAAFCSMMIEAGLLKSLGVLLPALCQQFESNTHTIGFIISLSPGFGTLTCPLAGVLGKRYSSRLSMLVLSTLSCLGLLLGSFATTVPVLVIALILTGFMYGAETTTFAVLSEYFDRYYDVADGISHAGVSFGIMLMPPLTQFLLDLYGWHGAMLLLGAITAHLIICGVLLRPIKLHGEKVTQITTQSHNNQSGFVKSALTESLDLNLLVNPEFMTLFFLSLGNGYFCTGWMIYLVPHALNLGYSPYKGTSLSTAGGIGHLVGTCVFPITAKLFSAEKVLLGASVLAALALALDPLFSVFHSYGALLVVSFAFMFSRALISYTCFKILNGSIEDDSTIHNAVSYIYVSYGVGSVISGFFSGWFFDKTGSYILSFLVLSAVALFSVTPRIAWNCRHRPTVKEENHHYNLLHLSDNDD